MPGCLGAKPMKKMCCDRCQREIFFFDQRLTDHLEKEYPGKDICPDCDLEIFLATEATKIDLLNNHENETALKLLARLYKIFDQEELRK